MHHSGEELAELRQRSAESEVNELELKARLKGDGRPDLNQALGAQPATACDKLEEVSNCLKHLWSPIRCLKEIWCPTHPPVAPVHEDEWVHHSGEELAELRQRSAESEVNEFELKARLKGDGP